MKWVFVLLLILLPVASAHGSFALADVYSPGHTLAMLVPENIVGELDPNAVILYRDGHIQVPWDYGVAVRGAQRYIWGVTPLTLGNYSIVIQDALVMQGGTPVVEDVSFPFIIRGNVSLYSFTPGVIDLNASSLITVTSRADTKITLPVESEGTTTITLSPGKNIINLSTLGIGYKTHFILGDYDLPVLGLIQGGTNGVSTPFTVSPSELVFSGVLGSVTNWNVTVTSISAHSQKITISYNHTLVSVSPDSLSLASNQTGMVVVTLQDPLRSSITSGIFFETANYSYALSLSLALLHTLNASDRERNYTALLCPEVPGFICRGKEVCGGEAVGVSGLQAGEICCSVACTTPSSSSSSWLPWLLFLLACALVGGAYYFYRVKKHPNQFQEQLKNAERKIHP